MNYQHVPFKEYNGHFIRNDVDIPQSGKYLLIESYETFCKYFGIANIGGSRKYVTPEVFNDYCVLAVLKDFAANAKVNSVVCSGPTMVLTYTFDKFETKTWTGYTPLIVSVPKVYIGHPHCTNFQFLRHEAMFAINSLKAGNSSSADNVVGGWSDYHGVNEEEKEIFAKGMENLDGVKYIPVLCKCQVVAGMNYTFICLARGVYPQAKWALAKVSMHRAPDGRIYRKGINDLGPIENMHNIDQRIRDVVDANA
ncbi:hypothetical protein [Citrobacter rodentium]|uniref:Uncharacterized protein n=2 Tax=Citrobacter rodentium TaxID=67825 RepID=D2TQN1_CITRI|nr:hypothetical protein [Citrobacter rodentium]QBY28733.1 hypothetical protein E2R62_07625 [Citrobacter rodentium]UHO29399.1 hypothetical protein K7R23_15245 [Citrobacter rodentium NBRC 105723 = DSM 16636]CBG88963.1 hypothetical protein ROD_22141 [Citrobacter rodentium ICC168]HAT8011675.1 hypothetical protein [Citrobacter rodentium NBRC 105723 = DSM 16636]HAT8016487.1 hypothetical protein [Citrobacter rodentium]